MRFLHIGNGDKANLKTLFGLLQLPCDCLAIGVDRGQSILRSEDIEISLRNAHNQVLLRGFANRFGPGDGLVGTPQVDDLVPPEQRLSQADPVLQHIGFVRRRNRDGWKIGVRVRNQVGAGSLRAGVGATRTNLRQQSTTGLGFGFQRGEAPGFRLVNLRIALQGLLIDFEQGRCPGRSRNRKSRKCDN